MPEHTLGWVARLRFATVHPFRGSGHGPDLDHRGHWDPYSSCLTETPLSGAGKWVCQLDSLLHATACLPFVGMVSQQHDVAKILPNHTGLGDDFRGMLT